MKARKLKRNFYTQPTLKVAQQLLGKFLVRKIGSKTLAGMIVETEAYIGPQDKASHAFGGKRTARNQAEWMTGGHIYIYLVYGMYWQLNISTGKEDRPECVLIRAIQPTNGIALKGKGVRVKGIERAANGPGKLCRWLKLNKSFYGEDVTKSRRIWLEEKGIKFKPSQIKKGPRIGIDYAGLFWSKKPWRFWLKDNPCVSK